MPSPTPPESFKVTDYTLTPLTENTLSVTFEKIELSAELAQRINICRDHLTEFIGPALVDCVPAYNSLLVYYDPIRLNESRALTLTAKAIDAAFNATTSARPAKEHILPVCYDPKLGWDIEALAAQKKLSCDELAELHSEISYTVYALGFMPGFAYLGFVSPRLAAPRLATPRTSVPWGAVGIADRQTGIYPASSPGGWNIIGRTPAKLLDEIHGSSLLNVGDTVRLSRITLSEYQALTNQDATKQGATKQGATNQHRTS